MISLPLLIDLDGTLIDTERLFTECFVRAATVLNFPISWQQACEVVGLTAEQSREYLHNKFGNTLPLKEIECIAFQDFHKLLAAEVPLREGCQEFLKTVFRLGIPFAVATVRKTADAKELLSRTKVGSLMTHVYGCDLVAKPKPDPDIFLYAANKLNFSIEECLVIEDSNVGITAALASGSQVIALKGLGLVPDDILCRCSLVVDSFSDLTSRLPDLI
jgi:HAD superfamily hydrolase (TIGR01509 family)